MYVSPYKLFLVIPLWAKQVRSSKFNWYGVKECVCFGLKQPYFSSRVWELKTVILQKIISSFIWPESKTIWKKFAEFAARVVFVSPFLIQNSQFWTFNTWKNCCIFWPVNRCFAHCSLVENIFFYNLSPFTIKNGKKRRKSAIK